MKEENGTIPGAYAPVTVFLLCGITGIVFFLYRTKKGDC